MKRAAAILTGLMLLAGMEQSSGAPPAVTIYDTKADGEKQIATAVATAKKEGKRVLVVLGANWCPWCRELHKVFENQEAVKAVLNAGYVVVFIDVDGDHNRGVDIDLGDLAQNGIPQLVILDAAGKKILAKDPADWEKNRSYDVAQVTAFLRSNMGDGRQGN